MEIKVEEMQIGEYKDTEEFKKLKQECYHAATNDLAIDFHELPPPEYKYFSELYWLYNDMSHGRITEDAAREQEQKNYAQLKEDHAELERYLANIAFWNNNIRMASTELSALCKAENQGAALEKALGIIGKLLNDSTIEKTVMKNVGGKNESPST